MMHRPLENFCARLAEPRSPGKRNWCAASLAAGLCLLLAGRALAAPPDVWRVEAVPDVRALCHAGDSLWVGTSAGVFVLDLRTGSVARRIGAGRALPSASVRAIASHGDSVLVGTDDGLALFSPRGYQQWTRRNAGALRTVPLTRLRAISFARNRDWMLATGGGGAGIVTASGGYSITRADSLPSNDVIDILERPDGVRWFATSTGLYARTNDTTFTSFQAGAGLPRGRLRAMTGDASGAYLLFAGIGVFRFDGARATAINAANIPLREARAISLGPDGTLWAVGRGWIARGQGKRWERVKVGGVDAAGDWRVVRADGAGAFVGSANGVVQAVGRGADWRMVLPGTLPSMRADGIRADGQGGAWLVSAGRPVRVDARARAVVVEDSPRATRALAITPAGDVIAVGRWTVSRRSNGVWADMVPDVPGTDPVFAAVDTDPAGRIWVGTADGDAFRFDGEVWLRVASAASSRPGGIRDVLADDGTLLARAGSGSERAGSGKWTGLSGIDSSAAIVDITQSPTGDWVAATANGFWRLDKRAGRWRTVSPLDLVGAASAREFKAPGAITAITFDRSGRLWVGTEAGLGRVDRSGTTWLAARDGLGGTAVADLEADEKSLWIGFASEGLSVVTLVPTR